MVRLDREASGVVKDQEKATAESTKDPNSRFNPTRLVNFRIQDPV